MTVLSRSKNAAARVTRHDCKWTARTSRAARAPSTPVRVIHSSPSGSGTVCPLPAGLVPCPPPAPPPPAPSSSAPTTPSSTTCSGCSPPRAPRPSSPPAARPCAAPTGTRRWSSSAPTPSAAPPCGRCRAGRAWSSWPPASSRPTEWASAVELGAERVAVLPDDESWLLARAAAAVRSPVERGWLVAVGGSCGGAGASTVATAVALAAAPGVLLVDGDPWGGGLDLLLGAERADGLRWPDLAGLRGRVAGDALLAALPEVAGVHVLAHSRDDPEPVPDEALVAVVEARPVRRVPGRGRPAPGGAADGRRRGARRRRPGGPRGAGPAARGDRGPAAGGRAGFAAGRRRTWWSGRVPGGLARAEVADVVGRPVLAELPHDRSAVPRGERGEPPGVAARSPLGRRGPPDPRPCCAARAGAAR